MQGKDNVCLKGKLIRYKEKLYPENGLGHGRLRELKDELNDGIK